MTNAKKITAFIVAFILWGVICSIGSICICSYRENQRIEDLKQSLAAANKRVRERAYEESRIIDGIGKSISDIDSHQSGAIDSNTGARKTAERIREILEEIESEN